MVLAEPVACPPLADGELDPDVTVTGICGHADVGPELLDAIAAVLVDSFGASPDRAPELATELRRGARDARVSLVLVRVDGEPAAVAKATAFDGFVYLSSIGTREPFRGRGLGALATRHAVALGGGGERIVYLGVFSGNLPAIRLYGRLGFASTGEAPDLILA
jgi:ribosomal protein S18 acetylase RimI-like enzyme